MRASDFEDDGRRSSPTVKRVYIMVGKTDQVGSVLYALKPELGDLPQCEFYGLWQQYCIPRLNDQPEERDTRVECNVLCTNALTRFGQLQKALALCGQNRTSKVIVVNPLFTLEDIRKSYRDPPPNLYMCTNALSLSQALSQWAYVRNAEPLMHVFQALEDVYTNPATGQLQQRRPRPGLPPPRPLPPPSSQRQQERPPSLLREEVDLSHIDPDDLLQIEAILAENFDQQLDDDERDGIINDAYGISEPPTGGFMNRLSGALGLESMSVVMQPGSSMNVFQDGSRLVDPAFSRMQTRENALRARAGRRDGRIPSNGELLPRAPERVLNPPPPAGPIEVPQERNEVLESYFGGIRTSAANARARQQLTERRAMRQIREVVKKPEVKELLKERPEDTDIEAIPTSAEDNTCIVCGTSHVTSMIFPCLHYQFCLQCINMWKVKSNTCPICRMEIGSIVQPRGKNNIQEDGKKQQKNAKYMIALREALKQNIETVSGKITALEEAPVVVVATAPPPQSSSSSSGSFITSTIDLTGDSGGNSSGQESVKKKAKKKRSSKKKK